VKNKMCKKIKSRSNERPRRENKKVKHRLSTKTLKIKK
jgi:hypothetical protein